jgi:uncharacterized protein (DUF342 family)
MLTTPEQARGSHAGVTVAEQPTDPDPAVTLPIEVNVIDHGMRAVVTIHEGAARDEVLAALADAGVVFGIDFEALDAALAVPGDHQVAFGLDPQPGEDGCVRFAAHQGVHDESHTGEVSEDGRVDLRGFAHLAEVHEGDLIALVDPPAEGIPGTTVLGETLAPKPGAPARVVVGDNVRYDEEAGQIVATAVGLLETESARIAVRAALPVRGDVGFESGSIEFGGDVVVEGSVESGFRVHAGGRVFIRGDVDNAEVIGGSLVVVQGAVAGERSIIRSDGDVGLRTICGGRVEARGNVFVEREVRDAVVHTSGMVVVEQSPGRLIGGEVVAGAGVYACEIGSKLEAPTRVCVGIDPLAEGQDEREAATPTPVNRDALVVASMALHRAVSVEIGHVQWTPDEIQLRVAVVVEHGEVVVHEGARQAPKRPDTMRAVPGRR